jgi:16S rRNA G966 N2-methylase RsmD
LKTIQTSNGKKGGTLLGKSHAEGGIKAVVVDTQRPIEVESGEVIINKHAAKKHWKELSEINQSAGNGVPIGEPMFSKGGNFDSNDKTEIYEKWKQLVNMSYSELKNFYDSEEGKIAGLTKKEADSQGIHSGRESAKWIMKMKKTPNSEWTLPMWRWAKRQISFVSRMSGMKGELYDEKGNKTRKHLALLIWGHNPVDDKFENGGEVQLGDNLVKITFFQTVAHDDSSAEFLYEGFDKQEAKYQYDNVSVGDFPKSKGGYCVLESQERTYKFVYDLEDEETIEDYPLKEYYLSDYWELESEGDFEVIESKDVEYKSEDDIVSELAEKLSQDIENYLKSICSQYKYAAYLGSTFYGLKPYKDGFILIRLTDHYFNSSNIKLGKNVVWQDYDDISEEMTERRNIYGVLSIVVRNLSKLSNKLSDFYSDMNFKIENQPYKIVKTITYFPNEYNNYGELNDELDYQDSIDENIKLIESEIDKGLLDKAFDVDDYGNTEIELFENGGGIKTNCIDFINNSEPIKNNGYLHHFRSTAIYSNFGEKAPDVKNFYLITYNSGGQNNLKIIDTINTVELRNELQKHIGCTQAVAKIIVNEFISKAKRFNLDDLSKLHSENIIIADRDTIAYSNIDKFEKGGLLAPNGNQSNLTPEQYKLVRTPQFKAFFGDWENDPSNASKVVDSNGEPLVVYHATNYEFNIFKKDNPTIGVYGQGFYFTNDKSFASNYARGINSKILSCFINVKKIFTIYNDELPNGYEKYSNMVDNKGISRDFTKKIISENYDGVYAKNKYNENEFVVFESNQIKLADGTNTTFDENNNDIRYAKGGGIIPASGTLTTKDKKNKLDYKKVGDNYEFVVYDGEANPIENYTRVQYKKRDKNKVLMNYNQFVNYLFSEGYIDDKMAQGGSITCSKCNWSWDKKYTQPTDAYICHKCGHDNTLNQNKMIKKAIEILNKTENLPFFIDKSQPEISIKYIADQAQNRTDDGETHNTGNTYNQTVAIFGKELTDAVIEAYPKVQRKEFGGALGKNIFIVKPDFGTKTYKDFKKGDYVQIVGLSNYKTKEGSANPYNEKIGVVLASQDEDIRVMIPNVTTSMGEGFLPKNLKHSSKEIFDAQNELMEEIESNKQKTSQKDYEGTEKGTGKLYEFFTPRTVVEKMWALAYHYGFKGGSILEPAIGSGRMIEFAPKNSKITGFEINKDNFEIAHNYFKELGFDTSHLYHDSFEIAFLQPDRYNSRYKDKNKPTWLVDYPFDLVIANPPYGKFTGIYKTHFKFSGQFEHFFIEYSMQLVKSRGLGVFIVPSSFLRNGNTYNDVKERIFESCKLLDAYRLPSNIFEKTQIGTDIIVLQKK